MAELTLPADIREGEEYTIEASGLEAYGPFVRVSVNYATRSEVYKAQVADGSKAEFAAGTVALSEYAEHPGEMIVTLWTWDQREQLASLTREVVPRG